MVNQVFQSEETNEFIFTGKYGERLTVTKSQLLLESATEILLLSLRSIPGFFCEKHGKYYRVRISARCDSDLATLRSGRCLITLRLEETAKLMGILKSLRA